jgi:hypothetical protein
MKIAESFPLPDDEKITKGLAHCEERPAPYVIADEKCAIFSNSASQNNVGNRKIDGQSKVENHTFGQRIRILLSTA